VTPAPGTLRVRSLLVLNAFGQSCPTLTCTASDADLVKVCADSSAAGLLRSPLSGRAPTRRRCHCKNQISASREPRPRCWGCSPVLPREHATCMPRRHQRPAPQSGTRSRHSHSAMPSTGFAANCGCPISSAHPRQFQTSANHPYHHQRTDRRSKLRRKSAKGRLKTRAAIP
jgi:hypothetical protein